MRERQINYMIFERPVRGGKTWTRTPQEILQGIAHGNLFFKKETADLVANQLMCIYAEMYFTVFECREVGFTATLSAPVCDSKDTKEGATLCEDCGGQGWYAFQKSQCHDVEQCQCERCYGTGFAAPVCDEKEVKEK